LEEHRFRLCPSQSLFAFEIALGDCKKNKCVGKNLLTRNVFFFQGNIVMFTGGSAYQIAICASEHVLFASAH